MQESFLTNQAFEATSWFAIPVRFADLNCVPVYNALHRFIFAILFLGSIDPAFPYTPVVRKYWCLMRDG
ncbi:hypothetical protein PHLCEN_2v10186 [Hermanssonia centrifuga]|uniref:Uncharacterized protein n=1 Tax=Hermanssonia centrifuga TaxID=98765 RepID=A0A2R6NNK1_9APHY|nr:hypothetical protein PHLCEN_2v10186 [Hermanssonia centrifuga]